MSPTPSQTVGPFFSLGMTWLASSPVATATRPDAIDLRGSVRDGAGAPVPDAVVEMWQADQRGNLRSAPGWTGFGRSLTDVDGGYRFTTVKPGRVDERQAPHIAVSVFARGLLQRLVTRIYFPDEAEANGSDPLLQTIEPARRATLIAVPDDEGLRFDIHLQGERETVFLAW